LIYTASDLTEKMISVQKGLTEDYWIIVRKNLSDEFLSFEVTSAGINNTPVVSLVSSNTYSYTPTPVVIPSVGWLAASPYNDAIIETSGFTNSCLYDFDNLTGVLSNQEVLINNPYSPPPVVTILLGDGCAFSPDGQIIYMSVFDGTTNSAFIYRFDRSGGSGTVAATLQTSAIPGFNATMQARNDGKIYFNIGNEPGLSVITDPNNFSTPNILLNNYMFPSGVADISLANDFKVWAEQILPTNIAGDDTTLCTDGPVDLGCSSCDSIGASYFWEPAAMVLNPNNKTTQTISLSANQTFMVHVMYCGDTISTDTMDVIVASVLVPLLDTIGSICTNENAVLTATTQSGGVINWYSDAGLSTNVGSGTSLNLGNVTTPGEHIYYATETVGPCESVGVAYTFWTSDCPAYPCAVNLIANGDFENYLSCPDDGYSIFQDSAVTVTDWENGIIDVAVASNLTPDYYNQSCGFFGSGTYSAPYDSPNGQAYAGFISTAPFGAPEKEMLGMMYDFKPCQEYTLQLKIIQGTTAVLSAPLSTDIVIYGGNSGGLPLLSPTVCPLDQGFEIMATIPFGSIDSIWRTFDLVFTPSGNYDCFIIGADCTTPSIGLDAVFVDDVFLCVDPCAHMATNIIPLSLSDASCSNNAGSGSVSFTTNCYTGFDFNWLDGSLATVSTDSVATGLAAGSYTVEVTDSSGCMLQTNVVIDFPVISLPLIDTIGSICTNENAVLTATAQSGGVINWYSDAGLSTNVGSGTTLNLGNVTTPGVHIYYATEAVDFCESAGVAYTFWTSDCPEHPCAVNLIANGDFENYLSCPDDGYSIYQDSAVTVTDWENGIIDVAVESNLTPDYYNQSCGFFGSNTYSAPYDSPNGQGYAGFISTAPFGDPEKEMLGMMYDFEQCQEYTLQLKIIQGTTAVLSAPLSTDIVIYGGNSGGLPLLSPTACPLDQGFEIMATIPFGSIDSIWRTFDLVFTPSANFDCFIIGADCTNPSIGLDAVFVDDVFICVDPCANIVTDILPLSLSNSSCSDDAGSASVSFTTNCYTGFDFNWLDGSLATVSTDSVATGLASGTYTVEVTDSNGCMIQTVVVIEYPTEACFSIPGGLSPNGDLINDYWLIDGLSSYPDAKVWVFNRWGQQVYTGNYETEPWDGTYKGEDLPTADYYYIIDLGNGEKHNGVVTLKR